MHLEYRRLSRALYKEHITAAPLAAPPIRPFAQHEMHTSGYTFKQSLPSILTTASSKDDLSVAGINLDSRPSTEAPNDSEATIRNSESLSAVGEPSTLALQGRPLPSIVTDSVFTGRSPDLGEEEQGQPVHQARHFADSDVLSLPMTSVLSGVWRLLIFQAYVAFFW